MISVEEALERAFALVRQTEPEQVEIGRAGGRVLREKVTATRNQPPFAASAMDGYAVPGTNLTAGQSFTIIGEAAAGSAYQGAPLTAGQAVRIFTGAPLPDGANRVVIQEDVTRQDDRITLGPNPDPGPYIRPEGNDFRAGQEFAAPKRLGATDLALLAAMNASRLTVARRPDVAIIATGDELVQPGQTPAPDQIISSNALALAEIVKSEGARAHILPIARDNTASIRTCFNLATGADIIVTSGGASVGDHDLIGAVAAELGMEQSFYKVAMRPGKPLMAGRLGDSMVLGLPGNPVSSTVCGHVFLRPVLRAMQGLPAKALPRAHAPLANPLPPNGPRAHYMRATLDETSGQLTPADRQDSALLSVLAGANALMIRPPEDPERVPGEMMAYLPL